MEHFGTLPDGQTVYRVRLAGGGLTASFLTFGAVLQDLRLEGHRAPLVLGFDTLEDYLRHSPYFGATPGRFANRIAGGRFTLDGVERQLELNEGGYGHLHGGSDGLAVRNWAIAKLAGDRVVLTVTDPDGRAGYPGNCAVTATVQLKPEGVLSFVYEATCDRPTPANICHHSYFNLDGGETILDHRLMIAADHYLPVDDRLIPTGEVRAVDATAFDFRAMRPIRRVEDGMQVPFDHNLCLSAGPVAKRSVALARSLDSGISMEVRTTEPGIQFYIGGSMDVPVAGLDGRRYGRFGGFCLETQLWPDAPNHENFPDSILRPGTILRQKTDYVFSRD